MSVHDNLGKVNALANYLCRLSMYSVAHNEEEKKDLVKDAHSLARLKVHLMSISDSGVQFRMGRKLLW